MPSIYYKVKFLVSMTLNSKVFINNVRSCGIKKASRVTDNSDKLDNKQYRN